MAVPREKIQALLAQHGARLVIAVYIKMRLRQRKSRGWEAVNNELRKKIYFSKLKVQNLRQFIPYSREQQIEEANLYLQKYLFCE